MNKFVMIPHEQFLKFKKYLENEKQNSYKGNTTEQESEQSDNAVTSSKAETGSNESLYMSPPPGMPESSVDKRYSDDQKSPTNSTGGRFTARRIGYKTEGRQQGVYQRAQTKMD